jgi:hypothetical protein
MLAYRPLVAATVTSSAGESIRFLALVDSGADACLFPLTVATLLKMDVLRLPKAMTGGVGSQSNVTYYDTVSIDLGNGIAFDAYVGFTEGMNSVGMALLGQDGFFEKFNVEFLHKQRIFTIEAS